MKEEYLYFAHSKESIHSLAYCRKRLEEIAQEEGIPESLLNHRLFSNPLFNSPRPSHESLIGLLADAAHQIIRSPSYLFWEERGLTKELTRLKTLMKTNIMEAAASSETLGTISLGIAAYFDNDAFLGLSKEYYSLAYHGYRKLKGSFEKCDSVPTDILLWSEELSTHCILAAENLPMLRTLLGRYFCENTAYEQLVRDARKVKKEPQPNIDSFLDEVNEFRSYCATPSPLPEIVDGYIRSLRDVSFFLELRQSKVTALIQKILNDHPS